MKTSTGWALAAIAVLAMGSAHAAQAGSKTGGSAPTGFSSGGQHKGFETFSNTSKDSFWDYNELHGSSSRWMGRRKSSLEGTAPTIQSDNHHAPAGPEQSLSLSWEP